MGAASKDASDEAKREGEKLTEAEAVLQVCTYYNGSYFHIEEMVKVVKRIDRTFRGEHIREAVREFSVTGEISRTRGRIPRYGIYDESRPIRLYNEEVEQRPGVRYASHQPAPHEEIVPMEGWTD